MDIKIINIMDLNEMLINSKTFLEMNISEQMECLAELLRRIVEVNK